MQLTAQAKRQGCSDLEDKRRGMELGCKREAEIARLLPIKGQQAFNPSGS